MRFIAYQSLLDKLNDKLPYGNIYHSLFFAGLLYLTGVVLSFMTGEQRAFFLDYASAAVIFGIAYMIYMETYIGNSYRVVAGEIFEVFGYDSTEDFRLIFNNRLRGGVGLLISLVIAWILIGALFGALWYQSTLLRTYLVLLGAVIGFIGGEAFVGALSTVRYVHRIARSISSRADVFNPKQMALFRSITRLGSDLSVFGGIVASVLLVSFFFAPWKDGILVVSGLGLVFLMIAVIALIFVFTNILVSVHQVMKSSKDEKLALVTKNLAVLLEKLQFLLAEESLSTREREIGSLNVALDNLEKVKGMIDSLPELSLDLGMARSFSSAIAIPIVVYIAQVLLTSPLH